jgi:hypothetical protein
MRPSDEAAPEPQARAGCGSIRHVARSEHEPIQENGLMPLPSRWWAALVAPRFPQRALSRERFRPLTRTTLPTKGPLMKAASLLLSGAFAAPADRGDLYQSSSLRDEK